MVLTDFVYLIPSCNVPMPNFYWGQFSIAAYVILLSPVFTKVQVGNLQCQMVQMAMMWERWNASWCGTSFVNSASIGTNTMIWWYEPNGDIFCIFSDDQQVPGSGIFPQGIPFFIIHQIANWPKWLYKPFEIDESSSWLPFYNLSIFQYIDTIHFLMVANLCAIMIEVLFIISLLSASCTIFSDSASNDDVVSSKTRWMGSLGLPCIWRFSVFGHR